MKLAWWIPLLLLALLALACRLTDGSIDFGPDGSPDDLLARWTPGARLPHVPVSVERLAVQRQNVPVNQPGSARRPTRSASQPTYFTPTLLATRLAAEK